MLGYGVRTSNIFAMHKELPLLGTLLLLATQAAVPPAAAQPPEGRFVTLSVEHGLSQGSVYAITQDATGFLWLGTWGGGLNRLDPESGAISRFLHDPDDPHSLGGNQVEFLYQDSLGVLCDDSVQAILEDRRGELAALEYTSPQHSRFAYQLEGVDPEWVEAGSRRYASYSHLEPGSYLFKAKAANNDGVWSDTERHLRLTIAPPFWRTLWFQVACALAAAGMLLSWHRLRTAAILRRNRQLQEINEVLNDQIAERRRAETLSETLVTQLRTSNDELQQFTYTVSHDLKSPLVTIRGFLGWLKKDLAAGDAERAVSDLEKIEVATGRMARLLDQLLELSRVGQVAGTFVEIPFAELAQEAAELVAGGTEERGVEVEIAPRMPAVHGDRVRLLQVLQNLLENAIKFMGEQPRPHIEIGFRADGGVSVFYVRDNGRGIAPAHRERIFQLFQQLDAEHEGTGIGLALVKRILAVHGGRIWVESEGEGHGSTFCFTLPPRGEHAAAAASR